ncbi:hypothetical protein [Paenibacillus abyssi]|uniref:Spore coat protein n=1 Tax=Paenibacillus abyssi TaxID=1340531 RepID=A0A917FPY3_9BACL|nr:hypothetical protein [Paenibacillus abyssi]GGF94046.1 hypothetical protein GCM10010916_09240 [Paenibacillus abyssi]
MWRIAGWLGKTIAAALIVSFLSIWTTGYIVNSYIETILKQYNLPLEVQPFAMSGLWGRMWGAEPVKPLEDADAETSLPIHTDRLDSGAESEEPPISTESGEGSGLKAGSGLESTDRSSTESAEEGDLADEATEDGAVPAWTEETIVSEEELSEAKEQWSEEDKQQMFSLLMSKLPQEAWQNISAYMEDGLTESELQDVQQIVARYLNDEEYKHLMEILKKY